MKLTVTTFTSLDGVMQGPGGPSEDPVNGFELGGWVIPFADEDFGRLVDAIFSRADEFLFGRTTYDLMSSYWPQVESEDITAVALNSLPKHVVTTRDDELDWNNAHAISGDVVEAIKDLKDRPGRELQVHGSHGLIQTLLQEGLVDEFNVVTFPVVLGEGKRLFGDGAGPMTIKLVNSETTGAGVIFATYEPAGDLVQQSVLDEDA